MFPVPLATNFSRLARVAHAIEPPRSQMHSYVSRGRRAESLLRIVDGGHLRSRPRVGVEHRNGADVGGTQEQCSYRVVEGLPHPRSKKKPCQAFRVIAGRARRGLELERFINLLVDGGERRIQVPTQLFTDE